VNPLGADVAVDFCLLLPLPLPLLPLSQWQHTEKRMHVKLGIV